MRVHCMRIASRRPADDTGRPLNGTSKPSGLASFRRFPCRVRKAIAFPHGANTLKASVGGWA